MRRLARILAIVAGVLVVAIALGFGALQLRPVQQALLDQVARSVSGEAGAARLGRITGLLPFNFHVDELHLADGNGEWLALRKLVFAMSPADLLRGRLRIHRLNIDEIAVNRLPPSGTTAAPPPSQPWQPPELPRLPVDVLIGDLSIAAIRLAPDVLGEPLAIAVIGAADIADSRGTARLAVRRIDGDAGHIELTLGLSGEPARLAVALQAAEPDGALVARMLKRADRAPLDLRLTGEGPLADWHGQLSASIGALAKVDADLTLAAANGYALGITAKAMARPLLPEAYGDLLGDSVGIEARLAATPTNELRLERLVVDAAAAKLEASGGYATVSKRIAANLALAAADLAPFSTMAGLPLGGAMRLELAASGPVTRPRTRLVLDGIDVSARGERTGRLRADLLLTASGDLGQAGTRYQLSGDGRAEGIASSTAALPSGFGTSLHWRLNAAADAAGDLVELRELALDMQGLQVQGQGMLRDRGATADGHIKIDVADLGALSEIAGRQLAGKGNIELTARSDGNAVDATVSGGLTELVLGDPALDALLAGRLDVNGKARREADGHLRLETMRLASAGFEVKGQGELSAERKVDGKMTLAMHDIALLKPALGMPVAGRLAMEASATGPLEAPDAKAEVTATGVIIGQRRLDRLHATAALTSGEVPEGRIDGTFRSGVLDGTLSSRFALRDARKLLDVSQLRLAANGTVVDGKLRSELDGFRTTGTVTARAADLAPWSGLASMPVAGRAELKAVLAAKGGQSADLDLKVNGLKLGAGSTDAVVAERIAVRARLADLLGKPSGRASLEAGRLRAAGAEIDSLSLQLASTRPGQFGFDGKTAGTYQQRFALTLAGDLRQQAGGEVLRLTRLDGQLAGEPLHLRRPLTVSRKGTAISLADLALSVGTGQIAGSGAIEAQRLALDMKAERLPVALLAKFAGKRDVSGQLGFEAQLSGTRARPQGRFALRAQSLRLTNGRQVNAPALEVAANANWRDGKVDLTGGVSGPKAPAIKLAGSVPLELEPASLAVRLPPSRPIALRVEGEGQLAELQDVLPIGEDRVAGRFAIDIRVSGTVGQPAAAGQLTLRDGSYESMGTGTVLRDMSLELVGDRQQLVLRSFRATDGERGETTGRGAVDLAGANGPSVEAAVQLRSFRALRRDEANLAASGEVRVAGPLTGLRATAQLRVEQGELRIPDRLPTRVVVLDVVEVNAPAASREPERKEAERKDAPAPGAGAVALDIKVDLPGRVFVRGRGLDGEWRGNLAVTGTSAAPIVTGSLQLVRGSVNVLDKQFTLREGTIRFTGGTKIDPVLDMAADTNAGDITGTVKITGTASAPVIKIGSRPELPQDEVLARILFGKSVSQITPAQGLRLAAAAASLVGGGPSYLDRMRSALGLDRFDIGGGRSTAGSGAEPSGLASTTVSAGKYVAEGIYVGVDQGASTSASRAKVEIEITPRVSVETRVGATGGNAVGLNWKMDY